MIFSLISAAEPDVVEAVESIGVESLISDLAFILILGAVTTLLFKFLKQPVVLGYIVAGFLASPHFMYLPSVTTEANIEFWAQIGIVILLFSLGIEFSFKKLVNAGGSAVVTALIIVVGMMGVGFAVGTFLGFSMINSLFLGGMLSMSSTTIIIKAFTDMNLRQKKFASLVFAVLIVEDLFAVLMMVILSSIAINNSVAGGEMIYNVSKLVFFLVMWFLVGVYVLPTALNRCRRYLNNETLLVVSMGLCLGMAVFSVMCGFSLALGAFVMGSILAGTSFAERIEKVTTPVKDLFGSVFFISVGMMVNPEVIVLHWPTIALLSVAVVIGMIVFGTFGMLLTGQSLKVAMESGFSLTQIGEFAFIIASLGMSLGVLDRTIYPIVVAVSVITTFSTPYFIRLSAPAYNFVSRHLPKRWHFLLDRYSERAAVENETAELWRHMFRRYLWRVLVYSILLVAITLVARKIALPLLIGLMPNWGRTVCAVATIMAMSPFLLALSLPASKTSERSKLRSAGTRYNVPLIVMQVFRLLIALGFIVNLLSSIYTRTVGWTVGFAVFLAIVFLFSKKVKRHAKSIEAKFLNNLNERELRRSGRNNNLVSNIHLAYMEVGYSCPFVGQRLADSDLRKRYGVNVMLVQRGPDIIAVPGGDTRLFPGDILGVVGTDEQIQPLIEIIESHDDTSASETPDIGMNHIKIGEDSPLSGKTVASSNFRKAYKSLLVAIQRGDQFLQPEANTSFEFGDTLWVIGDSERLKTLKPKRVKNSKHK